ncbi:MAG TPA: DNA polymerase III subunit gamma/tau [Gammaproteobacteria bacterium]|nr:DNA polymerase III subunit gamma/tau [Gammaproteobacteria bacterium]
MTYQALARTWRPKQFSEVVGQAHVVDVLAHALDHDRVHHALLFTGTRGVGKTTLARIFAKALNCESGISSQPCGVCGHCKAVDEGRFIDLQEVDAASRTRVDDTRELLDNVQYAPAAGRYKVYLIDEVHMLSGHSFNALLKTLEEPPAHVQFLLATTDPQKLPITVLSRCLQFHLRSLYPGQIVDRLKLILDAEKIPFEDPALQLLARASAGSMRDGLSLLDQAIAHGGGEVRQVSVQSMLGLIESRFIVQLLQALADGQARGLLDVAADIAERAVDYTEVLDSLLRYLYQLALLQSLPDLAGDDPTIDPELPTLIDALSKEDVQLYYQIVLLGKRDMPLAPDPRTGFEMCLLRMLAFQPGIADDRLQSQTQKDLSEAGQAAQTSTAARKTAVSGAGQPMIVTTETKLSQTAALPEQNVVDTDGSSVQWWQIIAALDLQGVTRELARNCVLVKQDAQQVIIAMPETMQNLVTPGRVNNLGEALGRYFGSMRRVNVQFRTDLHKESPAVRDRRLVRERQYQTEQTVEKHPVVQQLREDFSAVLVPGSVHPVDSLTSSKSSGEQV